MKPLAILLAVLIVVGAGLASLYLPQQYEATALLKVASNDPRIFARSEQTREDFAIFKNTQASLLRCGLVLDAAARDPLIRDLTSVQRHQQNPAEWLSESLTIDDPNNSEIMRIRMTGDNPEELPKIVNAVVESYLKQVVQHGKDQQNEQRNALEKSWSKKKAELAIELSNLYKLEQLEGVNTTEAVQIKKRMALDSLEDAMTKRNRLLAEIEDNDFAIKLAEENLQSKPAGSSKTGQDAETKSTVETRIAELQTVKKLLEERFAEMEKTVQQKARAYADLEKHSAVVASKKQDVESLQRITNHMKTELDTISVEAMAPDRIVKLEEATVSRRRDGAQRSNLFSLAAAVGLVLLAFGLSAPHEPRS